MAAFNKVNTLGLELFKGGHNLETGVLKAMLTNTAPVATNAVTADITEIAATGGYAAGGYTLDGQVVSQTNGTAKLVVTDETITAAGGSIGPFRYVVLHNSTNSKLLGWYDRGSSLTLADGEELLLDFDGTNGVLTLG